MSGNWWLGLGLLDVVPVGYWPGKLFTLLSDHATTVHWGGEVRLANSSGKNTVTQMGSGEFADKGFKQAAFFCNLEVAQNNDTLSPVTDFDLKVTHPNHYTIRKKDSNECGRHFFFGGPGPQRSGVIRETSTFLLFVMYFVFVVFI